MVNLYIKVGAKESLKDFKRSYMLKKTMAHRHMVMLRTQKREKAKAKITMREFQEDRTTNKSVTYIKLKASLLRLGNSFMWTVYTVAELKRLCAQWRLVHKGSRGNAPPKKSQKIGLYLCL